MTLDTGPRPGQPEPGMPCPVCVGAGYWDKRTGQPIYSKPPPDEAQRCMYCQGAAKAPEGARWA